MGGRGRRRFHAGLPHLKMYRSAKTVNFFSNFSTKLFREDTLDLINPESFAQIGSAILAIIDSVQRDLPPLLNQKLDPF